MRWDPAWFADRELDRAARACPCRRRPGSRRSPAPAALEAAVAELDLPARHPCSDRCRTAWTAERWRTIVTVPAARTARSSTRELAAMRARASARKDPDPVSVRVDPPDPTA